MFELFYSNSVNSLRVLITLEEADLSYEGRWVDLDSGEQHQEWFRAVNPIGLVPVLVDRSMSDGETIILGQTGAILLYLADIVTDLLPRQPLERIKAIEWCMHAVSDLSPLNAMIKYLSRDLGQEASSSVRYLSERLWRFFQGVECVLMASRSGYLQRDICASDFSVFPVVNHHLIALQNSEQFPALCDWAARLLERPPVRRALTRLTESGQRNIHLSTPDYTITRQG